MIRIMFMTVTVSVIHCWLCMFLNQSQFSALSSTHCPAKCTQRHTIYRFSGYRPESVPTVSTLGSWRTHEHTGTHTHTNTDREWCGDTGELKKLLMRWKRLSTSLTQINRALRIVCRKLLVACRLLTDTAGHLMANVTRHFSTSPTMLGHYDITSGCDIVCM